MDFEITTSLDPHAILFMSESRDHLPIGAESVFNNYRQRENSYSERQFAITGFFVTLVIALLGWMYSRSDEGVWWLAFVIAIVVLILTGFVIAYLGSKCRGYWLSRQAAEQLEEAILKGSNIPLPLKSVSADKAFALARKEKGDRPDFYWVRLLWSGSHGSFIFASIVVVVDVMAFIAILWSAEVGAP